MAASVLFGLEFACRLSGCSLIVLRKCLNPARSSRSQLVSGFALDLLVLLKTPLVAIWKRYKAVFVAAFVAVFVAVFVAYIGWPNRSQIG